MRAFQWADVIIGVHGAGLTHMVFMRPGDIVKFRPVDRDEYDDLQAKAEAGEFRITARPVEFVSSRDSGVTRRGEGPHGDAPPRG